MATIVTEKQRRGVLARHDTVIVSPPDAEHGPVEAVLVAVASDVDRVLVEGRLVGFVHRAGPVHVALRGPDLARAVEVAQSRDVAVAIAALLGQRE